MTDYSHTHPLVPPAAVARWLEVLPQPVAITGGTGFVGSHLVDTLCAAGLTPKVLVRDTTSPRWIDGAPVERVPGSLEDGASLARLVREAGTVFHLAGVLRAGSEAGFDRGNRRGTANLVDALQRAAPDARLVHVSSLAAVGPSAEPDGVGPEAEPAPISWYGRSKLAAECEVRRAGPECWWSIVRPPAIYGPRDSDIFEFFRMANRGVVAVPAGERWLTVAWVGDVVRSIVAAAVGESEKVFHLGEPVPMLMDTLISQLCGAGGVGCRLVRIPPFVVSSAGAIGSALHRVGWHRLPLTADKARELLARHWTARTVESSRDLGIDQFTGFPEGAARCWEWYREQDWLR
ncbi:MAG: NAD-dependent epimerase/dehydratase family protein [Acidobacteriota bacterium]|nr:NAD-dependent epimerase/dehydratase family protein [Acidobacteriota bacterium]